MTLRFWPEQLEGYRHQWLNWKKLLEVDWSRGGLDQGLCFRGARGTQLGKHPTLDFSSGVDLRVMSSSPTLGSKPSMESTFLMVVMITEVFLS